MNQPPPPIIVRPRNALHAILLFIAFLAVAHLMAATMKQLGHERMFGLVRMFDMDRERNFPTLFSTCLFLTNAFLCFAVWRSHRLSGTPWNTWMLLSMVLVFLACDESMQIHEQLQRPTEDLLNTTPGFFGSPWVIPYGIALLFFLGFLVPFFLRQERLFKKLFVAAGAVFVGGAIGVEMLASKYLAMSDAAHGESYNMMVDMKYDLFVLVEESFEMLGLAILVFALLTLLERTCGGLCVLLPPVSKDEDPGNTVE